MARSSLDGLRVCKLSRDYKCLSGKTIIDFVRPSHLDTFCDSKGSDIGSRLGICLCHLSFTSQWYSSSCSGEVTIKTAWLGGYAAKVISRNPRVNSSRLSGRKNLNSFLWKDITLSTIAQIHFCFSHICPNLMVFGTVDYHKYYIAIVVDQAIET